MVWTITVTSEVVRGKKGPTAVYTKLGWVLSGPTGIPDQCTSSVNVITSHILRCDSQPCVEEQRLNSTLRMFWELESLGINEDNDLSVLESFDRGIAYKDGRYQVSLPWKESHAALPDNYQLSKKRLLSLVHRLKQNPSVLREYDATIRDQLSRGIVEVVDSEEDQSANMTHYIPHHAVIRQDKETTKLHIVYDASARGEGPSLNDCLCIGPKFGQNIMDIVLRFRVHNVALAADIEKAFLMISVSESDRDVLRFLWVDDVSAEEPGIITLRFTRVMFGVSSSPFLLNATVQHHLKKYSSIYPELVEKISHSIYVDDIASGANDEGRGYEFYSNSKMVLKDGGFNLRKFVTNSSDLQKKIYENERLLQLPPTDHSLNDEEESESYTKFTLGTTQKVHTGEVKILGVKWNSLTDSFIFDFSDVVSQVVNLQPTKRNVVGIASKFYDPLGFVSPVTIRFKVLFQEMCEAKIDWDDVLPPELQHKWESMVSSLQKCCPISIPRCYFDGVSMTMSSCCLQGFCDASKTAYAAVVYLSIEVGDNHITKFVACKTRVAPLKEQTIPRLELLSAVLLSKLMKSVSQALDLELTLGEPSYFTDSMVTLYWIKGQGKEWKPFVQNRVNQIHGLTAVDQWQHCAGVDNPADILSKGMDPGELSTCSLWLHGPTWIHDGGISLNSDDLTTMPEECGLEQKKAKNSHTLIASASDAKQVKIASLMRCEDFSSKTRLLRVTAQVVKCAKIWI